MTWFRRSTIVAALVGGLLAVPGMVQAKNLQSVGAQPNPAAVGQTVTVTVKTGSAPCAYTLDTGSGPLLGPFGNGNGTKIHTTQYAQPGSYTITVQGKKKGSKPACGAGPKTTTVVVQGSRGGGGQSGHFGKVPGGALDAIVQGGGSKQAPNLKMSCDAVPCVTKVDVDPHGTYADFEIATSQAASVQVYASTKPLTPNALGTPPHSAMSFAYKHLSTARLMNLKAGTRYYVAVKAVDGNGVAMWKKAQFETLRRKAVVTLQKVVVKKDGDGPTMGKGDFMVGFHTDGTVGGTKYVHFKAGDGDTFAPLPGSAIESYLDAPAEFGLFATATEHDNPQVGGDEKASKTTAVTAGESGLAEGGTQKVQVRLVDGFDITVHFEVAVQYVP